MKVVPMKNVARREDSKPCKACNKPLTKKIHEWTDSDGNHVGMVCSHCHNFLLLSPEEKLQCIEEAKIKKEWKVCSSCKVAKSEDVKTLLVEGKGIFVCTTCIERVPLTAEDRMKINTNEMLVKKLIADSLNK